MNLTLISIEKDGVIRVAAEGELTGSDIPNDGKNPMAKVVGEHWSANKVALSFDKATYLDSAAIGWLLNTVKEFQNAGGRLVLHSVPPRIQQLFDMLKINAVLPVVEDEKTALEQLNGGN